MNDTQRAVWEIIERMQGQIAGNIRELLGEPSYDESNFTDSFRQNRVLLMQTISRIEKTENYAEQRHRQWCEQQIDNGWTYGEEFSTEQKTHPNLVEWDKLPKETKVKAEIFDICARAGAAISELID